VGFGQSVGPDTWYLAFMFWWWFCRFILELDWNRLVTWDYI